jgi:hypothetical protein
MEYRWYEKVKIFYTIVIVKSLSLDNKWNSAQQATPTPPPPLQKKKENE